MLPYSNRVQYAETEVRLRRDSLRAKGSSLLVRRRAERGDLAEARATRERSWVFGTISATGSSVRRDLSAAMAHDPVGGL